MNLRNFQRGLSALILAGAPQEDIDAYFAEEGIIQDPRLARTAKVEQDISAMAEAVVAHIGDVSKQVNMVAAAIAGEMAKLNAKVDELAGIEKKVNILIQQGALDNDDEIKNELGTIQKAITNLQNKPVPTMPKVDMSKVDKLEAKLVMLEKTTADNFDRLINAKRIPEFDSFGNVIAVRLEK